MTKTAAQEFRSIALDAAGMVTVVLVWVVAIPVFIARALRSVGHRLLVTVYLATSVRWWLVSKASGQTYSEVARGNVEQFSESVAQGVLSLPQWAEMIVIATVAGGFISWKIDQHSDQLVHLWRATTWKEKVVLTAMIATLAYVRFETDLLPGGVTRPAEGPVELEVGE